MRKKQRHGPMGCPAKDCSGGRHDRQHPLTPGQEKKLSQDTRDVISESNETCYRCNYCGCLYLRWPSPRILGFLDSGVLGEGWHPSRAN